MTSPLNEPMTEAKAREIEVKHIKGEPMPPANFLIAQGYLLRVEQEKELGQGLFKTDDIAGLTVRMAFANEALEAADRMENFISNRRADEFYGEDCDRLDADITIYRAARAKVGG